MTGEARLAVTEFGAHLTVTLDGGIVINEPLTGDGYVTPVEAAVTALTAKGLRVVGEWVQDFGGAVGNAYVAEVTL